jgi:hypothetical protein
MTILVLKMEGWLQFMDPKRTLKDKLEVHHVITSKTYGGDSS